jgi:hypothetical protein
MHFLHVVGARPNFMKAAPVMRALSNRRDVRQTLVHTGQHHDSNMSDVFFSQLDIPAPDVNLDVGSGSHARQTAEIMRRIEPVLSERKPDIVLVYGDVNSIVAAALVCSKLLTRIAHVEARLRSFDRTMPEEVNRLVTDRLADLLFTPSADGDQKLQAEGVEVGKIHLVGNVMIDSLIRLLPFAMASRKDGLREQYALVTTLPRPCAAFAVAGQACRIPKDLHHRESPSLTIIELLQKEGAQVSYNDPYFPAIGRGRKYDLQMKCASLDDLGKYDCVVIVTDHSDYNYRHIVREAQLVVDSRNATRGIDSPKIVRC